MYQSYLCSKKARKRYASRELVDTTGRETADEGKGSLDTLWTQTVQTPKATVNSWRIPTEGYDYFVFEFVYFQLPIIACQLFGRMILPKKIYFNFIAVIGALSVLSICSLRMFLFILLISYVSKTFQKEHPFFQWTATLIGLTFSGYVRYRGQYYGTTILEIQILLASLFRMIGCCPIEGTESNYTKLVSQTSTRYYT